MTPLIRPGVRGHWREARGKGVMKSTPHPVQCAHWTTFPPRGEGFLSQTSEVFTITLQVYAFPHRVGEGGAQRRMRESLIALKADRGAGEGGAQRRIVHDYQWNGAGRGKNCYPGVIFAPAPLLSVTVPSLCYMIFTAGKPPFPLCYPNITVFLGNVTLSLQVPETPCIPFRNLLSFGP